MRQACIWGKPATIFKQNPVQHALAMERFSSAIHDSSHPNPIVLENSTL